MSWRQLGPTSPGARSSGSRFTTAHSREAHLHQKPLQYISTDDDEDGPVIDQDGNDEGISHSSPSKMSVVAASGLPSRIAADDVASARPSDRHHPYLSRDHRPRSSMPMMSRAASGDELRLPPLTTLITSTSSRDASSTSSPSPASYDSFSVPSPSLMTSQSYNTRAPSPTSSVAASPPSDWRRGGQADEAASTSSASSNPLRVQLPPLASLSIAQSQRPNISSSKSLSAILPESATGGSLSNLSPSLDGVLAQGPRLPPIMSSISPRAIPSPNSSLNDASLMESDRLSTGENEVSQSSFGPVRTRNAGSAVHHEANRSRKSTPTYSYGGSAPAHVQSHRSHLSTSASHHPSYDRPSQGLLQDIFVQAFQLNDEYFGGGRGARQLPSLRDKGASALLMMIRQEVEILAQRDPQLADQLAYDAGLSGPQSPPVEPEPFAPFQAKRNRVRSSTSSSDVDHPFQHRMQQSYFGKHGVHDRRAGEDDDGDVAAMGDYSTTRGQPLLPPLHSQHYHHHHQLQQQQQQQHFSQSQYNQVQRPSSSSPRQPQHFTAPIASEPSSSPHASSSAGNLVRTQSKPNASSQPPKRVRKRKDEAEQSCLSCSATETPEWRKGPTGPRTLCNACGLLFAKQSRRREQDALARGDRPLKGRASAQDEMTEEEKHINLQELRLAVNARSLGTAGPSTMATTTTTVTTATPPFVAPAPAGVAPPTDAPHPLYARQHSPPSSRLNARLPPPSLPGSASSTRWHESPEASARRHQHHSRSFPPPYITMSRDVSSESIIGNTRRHPLPPSSFEQEEHDELAEDVAMT